MEEVAQKVECWLSQQTLHHCPVEMTITAIPFSTVTVLSCMVLCYSGIFSYNVLDYTVQQYSSTAVFSPHQAVLAVQLYNSTTVQVCTPDSISCTAEQQYRCVHQTLLVVQQYSSTAVFPVQSSPGCVGPKGCHPLCPTIERILILAMCWYLMFIHLFLDTMEGIFFVGKNQTQWS